jgi:hypothetical protein
VPSQDGDEYVTITGAIHLVTSLGVFLYVDGRRAFVEIQSMQPFTETPESGATATLRVLRRFADQEGLV